MSFPEIIIALSGVLYLSVAVFYGIKGNWPWALGLTLVLL